MSWCATSASPARRSATSWASGPGSRAGLRTRTAPRGLHRYTVQAGSAADGAAVADLGLGERTWLSLVRREGELLDVRRDTRLHPGDQVLAQVDEGIDLDALFRRPS